MALTLGAASVAEGAQRPLPLGVVGESISVGDHHVCAIKTNGIPICWGSNGSGQSAIPDGTGTVTQISAGGLHTCAIKTDGTAACWGNSGAGRTTAPAGTYTQIAAGGAHTCAIKTDGTRACWGDNSWLQAPASAGTDTYTQISAGSHHTCAIKTDGSPACWGENTFLQATPPTGLTVSQISVGFIHSCAIKTDGTPTCWGGNSSEQIAIPDGTGTVTQISAGYTHTCAIKTDGTPACWGANFTGQSTAPAGTYTRIAAGTVDSCAIKTDGTPVCWGGNLFAIPPGSYGHRAVGAGGDHTCAIKTDGTPACWGLNSAGEATIPAGTGTVAQIAAGIEHSCAIKTDGTPTCWGANGNGQATIPDGTGTVTQIAGGDDHTCAIKTDGTPTCWGGDNSFGQAAIPDGTGTVTRIAAGGFHSCAIKTDGTPTCWGLNVAGQTTVPDGTGTVTQIAAGYIHTCAIKTDGKPTCWGSDNDFGQITVPDGTGTVTQIAAGFNHTCAIKTDGTPTCWGLDSADQATIPDGTGTVTQITAGANHTCAIKTDGTATCWGDGAVGQRGAAPGFTSAPLPGVVGPAGLSATVTATATPGPVALSLDSGSLPPGMSFDPSTGEVTGAPTAEGTFSGTFRASNGMFEDATQAFSILADLTAPSSSDDVPSDYQNAPVEVTLTAGDTGGSGVDRIRYTTGVSPADPTLSGAGGADYNADSKPLLADGEKIRYLAVDEAGNAEAAHESAAAQVDSEAPSSSDDVPPDYQNAPVEVTLTAGDTGGSGVDRIRYTTGASPADPTLSGAGGTDYDPGAKPLLANGERIRYLAVDGAGNVETVRESGVAKVDTAAPEVSIAAPVDGASFVRGDAVNASYACSDEAGGSAVKSCVGSVADGAPLDTGAAGEHSFTVTATDNVGHTTTKTVRYGVREPAVAPGPEPAPRARLSLRFSPSSLVSGASVRVRCAVTGTALRRCAVTLVESGAASSAARGVLESGAADSAARRVLGRGARSVTGRGRSASVRVRLTRAGRRLLDRRLRATRVRAVATARVAAGPALSARASTTLIRRSHSFTTPPASFEPGSAELTSRGLRLLRRIADGVGQVKRISCVGYTANLGRGDTPAARSLGLARARAACAALRRLGVRTRYRTTTRGPRDPIADNRTDRGRDSNRRVTIEIAHTG